MNRGFLSVEGSSKRLGNMNSRQKELKKRRERSSRSRQKRESEGESEIEGRTGQYRAVQYRTSYVTYTWCDRAVSSGHLSFSHARSELLP